MEKIKLSKLYYDNIKMYMQMHNKGYKKIDGLHVEQKKSFNGISTIVKDGKAKVFPLQFNDKIGNYI